MHVCWIQKARPLAEDQHNTGAGRVLCWDGIGSLPCVCRVMLLNVDNAAIWETSWSRRSCLKGLCRACDCTMLTMIERWSQRTWNKRFLLNLEHVLKVSLRRQTLKWWTKGWVDTGCPCVLRPTPLRCLNPSDNTMCDLCGAAQQMVEYHIRRRG